MLMLELAPWLGAWPALTLARKSGVMMMALAQPMQERTTFVSYVPSSQAGELFLWPRGH